MDISQKVMQNQKTSLIMLYTIKHAYTEPINESQK